LRKGDSITLPAAKIEITITDMTDDGRAAEARFRFPVPLEDPSLRWLYVKKEGHLPFTPPKIGETAELPAFQ